MPSVRNQSAPRASRYASRPDRVLPQAEVQRDEAGDVIEEDDEDDVDRDAQGARDGEEEDEEDDGDDAGPAPSNEPADQALSSNANLTINRAITTWKDFSSTNSLLTHISDATTSYAEAFGRIGSKGEAMDKRFREAVDAAQEATIRENALKSVTQAVARGEQIYDAVDMYKRKVEEELGEYQKKTSRQKYLHHDGYRNFQEAVWEVYNEEAMPPLGDFIEREDGDEEDDDDEIDAGSVRQEYKCPLTMTILDRPVTSTTCRHSYSKAAIESYIESARSRREQAKCPRSGCSKNISSSVLQEDKDLAKRVQMYKRRLEQKEMEKRTQATAIID